MSDIDPVEKTESQLKALSAALETGTIRHASRMLNELNPAEIADLLESLGVAKSVRLEAGAQQRLASALRDGLEGRISSGEPLAFEGLRNVVEAARRLAEREAVEEVRS